MKNLTRLSIIILIFLAAPFQLALAQNYEKESSKKRKRERKLRDQIEKEVTAKPKESNGYIARNIDDELIHASNKDNNYYFVFNNINSQAYYYNAGQIAKIESSLKAQNDPQSIRLIESYMARFGVLNFSKNTQMIWWLGQLYEKNGEHQKAKAAYRLVLKHHPLRSQDQVKNFTKALAEYDQITALEKDLYVPLDYYYQLVDYRNQIDTLHPPKSVLLNMGDLVNLKNSPDYGPSINTASDLMIFTRKELNNKIIGVNNIYSENLYMAKNYDGFWDEALELPEPIKSACNEGSAVISNNGRFIVFSRCETTTCSYDCIGCLGGCDLFYATKDEFSEEWNQPINFGPEVNSIGWDSHPSLSLSEDTLFFASNRSGGFGLSDIYFITKTGNGNWSAAQNMGPVINTRGNEWSPFLSKGHPVLYFSSNGHVLNFDQNRYSSDLYKSNYNGQAWGEPKNLGPLVNGKDDETYFSIDSENHFLYYAKTEEGNTDKEVTDLYSFPVPMEAQPTATTVLSGTLVDEQTGKSYKGIVSIIDLENGIEVAPKFIRQDGSYSFDLIDHNKYLLVIQGDDFFRIEQLFELDGDTTINSVATSVQQKKLQFTSIEFENGKADILTEMHEDLNNIINFMVDNPSFDLEIGGHTDSDGNPELNKKLSQRRADAIKSYIVEKGYIEQNHINAIGYGSTKPIKSPELTNADKKINRRVEFQITKSDRATEGDD